jgi:hypothetical protein
MKTNGRLLMTITALLGTTQAAQAASTTTVYFSGWLVLAFFGLCALVVTVQLIPALIMLAGTLKALFSGKDAVNVRQTHR